MTLGSLFDGISGFPLAASWAGIETKWLSEIDPYCLLVSEKNFPNVKQYGDIKKISYPEPVDIISGGFPCQPFSVAGNQQGKEDNRYLWPEMLRIIREVKPRWVIGENVPGIINLALDEVLTSLENEGYKTETFIIPACALNAPHRRDRVWIVANSGLQRPPEPKFETMGTEQLFKSGIVTDSDIKRRQKQHITEISNKQGFNTGNVIKGWSNFPTQSPICRRNDGIYNRVDRIKSLGNAIVPQVAFEIFKAILEIEKLYKNGN